MTRGLFVTNIIKATHLEGLLKKSGVINLLRRVNNYNACKQARAFFAENQDNIKKILSFLSDDASIKTYSEVAQRRKDYYYDFSNILCTENQYLIDKVLTSIRLPQNTEAIFMDCGAYNGDTVETFIKSVPDFGAIYAFEPDPANCNEITKKFEGKSNVYVENWGVWSQKDTLFFSSNQLGSSKVTSKETFDDNKNIISINVNCIDSLNVHGKIFIKMDIEGSEQEALKGAETTIRNEKPILAICIYHSDDDYVKIPLWIHDIYGNDADYYVRHHSADYSETVFYAVPHCWL